MLKKTRYIYNKQELGLNLKIARERACMTQKEVSKIMGINRASLAFYEIGRSTPTIFILIRLSKIYQIELIDLLINKF